MTMDNIQQLRKFVVPEIVFGVGALGLAGKFANKLGCRRALVVTDPGVQAAGWAGKVIESLNAAEITASLYTGVTPNPREAEAMAAAAQYSRDGCDGIVAVGGGSALDCAKGAGIVSTNGQHILHYEGIDQVFVPIPPIICIPTTGGTSADVSQFAIIADTVRKTKIAIISKAIVPDVALVDPSTLTTMDSYLTACTGLDALVHAIEAFVSNASSPMTDLQALEAIRLVSHNLVPSIEDPLNLEIRDKVMMGSLTAGMAFSNASLGAVHAMAHSLGGFLDLAHGECNAMLLRHVVEFNFDAVPERFREVAKAFGLDIRGMTEADVKKNLLKRIDELRTAAGVQDTLAAKGVRTGDIPDLGKRAIIDPCVVTNPREPNARDLEVIYEEAL